ncbi:hypothetical protein [uncultured Sphingomonas sp.]|uniref:hypothetical protein n=1 Tax=uncultured Sphingomonas sp. TaxID=158754 RepID=UPI0035CC3339
MRPLTLMLAAAMLSLPIAATAADGPYRAAQPVSDDMLDTVFATALPGFARDARSLSDTNAQLYLQQVGVGSRIAMDNWWSQTGAALILNNVMSSPAGR